MQKRISELPAAQAPLSGEEVVPLVQDGSTVNASVAQLRGYVAIPAAEKGAANGVATLDAGGKLPAGQLPALDAIPSTEKGAANGVATLDAGGKLPVAQLPALDAIPTAEKGAANGVATLDGDGKLPAAQLPALQLGDVLYSVRDPGAGYIDATEGPTVLQAEYPALAAVWPIHAESIGYQMFMPGISKITGAVDGAVCMFASGADIYVLGAVGSEKLYRYTQGADLTSAPTTAMPISTVPGHARLGAARGDHIVLAAEDGVVYVSHDRGATWATVAASYTGDPKKLVFSEHAAAIIVGATVVISADNGDTWLDPGSPTYYDETADDDLPAAALLDVATGVDSEMEPYVVVTYQGDGEGLLAFILTGFVEDGWVPESLDASAGTDIFVTGDTHSLLYHNASEGAWIVSAYDLAQGSETILAPFSPTGSPIGVCEQPDSGLPVALFDTGEATKGWHYIEAFEQRPAEWESNTIGAWSPAGSRRIVMQWQLDGATYYSTAIGGQLAVAICGADRHTTGPIWGERLRYNPATEMLIPAIPAPAPLKAYITAIP